MKEREDALKEHQQANMTKMMKDVKLDKKAPWEGLGKDPRGDSWGEEEAAPDDDEEDSGDDIDRSA